MLGIADVALVLELLVLVKVECERGVERGGMWYAAARTRDGFLRVAAARVGCVVAEGGERVGGTAGGGEAGAVGGGDRAAKELLPPGSAVKGVGFRGGGLDAEGLEEGVEPALVLVELLASETEEDEEDVGEEGKGPEDDTILEVHGGAVGDEGGRDLVDAVKVVVGIFPRYPGEHGIVEGIGQNLEETEWEGDEEFNGREAHEAEVAIGVEARDRGVGVEELFERVPAPEKGTKGEHTIDDCDEGEHARPYIEERISRRDVVDGEPTA